jgi:iron complex outermembrane receptor protein
MSNAQVRWGASIIALACMAAGPVHAQDSVADQPIVVTGSLIRGSAEDGAAPVEVIGADDLAAQGTPSIMELTKRLTASAGVIGDASQFDIRSQFNQGVASINLRGLGPQRTLVLLNGRRIVATGAGILPVVDINLIPSSALDRVEILKDGAAATYGSDAIAGVVNFITRTNQDGFSASGDLRLIEGSNGDWNGALSWGGRLGGLRLFVSGGYQRRSELTTGDRDFSQLSYPENPQGGWSGGGAPGNFDFNGSVGGTRFDADRGCEALGGFRSVAGSSADLCLTSYLGFTNLVEPEERFQLFGDAELDLPGNAALRVTGLYGRTETVLTTSPSYLPTISPSSSAAFGGNGLFVIPSYAPALADYCARFGGCSLGGNGLPTQNALAFPVRFRPLLLGGNPLWDNARQAATPEYRGEQYQFAGELTVPVTSGLELTASTSWSASRRYFQGIDNFVDPLQNALAGFGGASCAYRTPQSRAGLSEAQLAVLAGTGGCSYFNPFSTGIAANAVTGQANPGFAGNGSPLGLSFAPGAGLVNDLDTIRDFFTVIERRANTSQWVADLVLAGDAGVSLPGGPVQFAAGAQYRRDRYERLYSDNNNLAVLPCPGSVLDPAATCAQKTGPIGFLGANFDVSTASEVFALFGELQLPLADGLQAQLSARYEDYGSAVGSTFDPQARVRYAVTDWLSLRGGVGTTFRGPPPQNTGADLVILTLIGSAFRAVDVRGNPDLQPETATTWNAGAQLDEAGFKASVDYWHYAFSGAIEAEPVSGITSALFGASGTTNCGNSAYAALQARFIFSGGTCAAANVQRLVTFAFNAAEVTTRGIDFSASYDWDLSGADLQAGVSGSHVMAYKVGAVSVEGIVVQPAFDAAGKLNFQTTAYPIPQWKGFGWLQARTGAQLLRLQVNHVSGYTDQRTAEFAPNASALAGASVPEGKQIGSFTTLDAAWSVQLPHGANFSLALFNLLDKDPPFARLDQNFDPFTASPLGRTLKVGVGLDF